MRNGISDPRPDANVLAYTAVLIVGKGTQHQVVSVESLLGTVGREHGTALIVQLAPLFLSFLEDRDC
jgi:hypothetical protein